MYWMLCWPGTHRRKVLKMGFPGKPWDAAEALGAVKAVRTNPRRGYRAKLYSGAPRSMKMGTILSRCPYDAAAHHALQSVNLRPPALLHYASCAAVFPI